ncbi:MAG: sugar phosphate isomerase/epimerase [Candidatus Solibacter sp.]
MMQHSRREWLKSAGAAIGAACLGGPLAEGAPARKLKIGITSINWGFRPDDAEPGIREAAQLGYQGYEVFGDSLDPLEAKGGLKAILQRHNFPMPSGYLNINLHDPTVRKKQMENMARWGKLLQDCGAHVAVMGPMGVNRSTFDFNAAKADIVATLNEAGKILADFGLVAALHQHTSTAVDTRDQVYAVMEAVDTRVMKFGPDVGQLLKSGSDPVKILKDFLPLVRNIHLKDYLGEKYWGGYCPLGQGKVDLPAVLEILENSEHLKYVMVELDMTRGAPMTPLQCATTSKQYLQNLGYSFLA